jgi:hypothetical protein
MNVAAAVVLIVTLVLVVVARARESQPVHVDPEMSS